MRIILFFPRGYDHSLAKGHVGRLASVLPPLGLATIAAELKREGHDVVICDGALENMVTNAQWADTIVRHDPDMVGFSAITPAFLDAYDVCRRVKETRSSIQTVFGGVHVSWGREQILRDFEAIDFVIAGEGETAFADLAAGKPRDSIPGLCYRNGETVLSAVPQDRSGLCTMDDLPFPAYELLPGFPRRYQLPLFSYRRHPGTHMISSRGCIYQCSYCDRSVFNRTFRWNSAEYTFEEVKWLATDYGIRHIYFYDDLFTLNRERVARLCALLRDARLGVTFNCIVRIGHIDNELIALLKSGGCWMVNVGIESGDQAILDQHKEGLRIEDIRRDVQKLYEAGLFVKGLFMMGFPGETEESAQKTIDLACSLPLKDANMTAFTPYPGAPITAQIGELGKFDNNWNRLDCMQFVFEPFSLPDKKKLEAYYAMFVRRFYKRPFAHKMYRKMMFESPHSYYRLLRNLPDFLGFVKKY